MKKTGEISAKEGPITTAADDEDAWRKELGSFQFGPRKTSSFFQHSWLLSVELFATYIVALSGDTTGYTNSGGISLCD